MNVTDVILCVRYRDCWEHPRLLNADEVVAIKVEAFPTSKLFKRGHRIRLDVSSSYFPQLDVNPNTGAPEGTGVDEQIARSVYLNRDRPSHMTAHRAVAGMRWARGWRGRRASVRRARERRT